MKFVSLDNLNKILTLIKDNFFNKSEGSPVQSLPISVEEWTFTLDDGTEITKKVIVNDN